MLHDYDLRRYTLTRKVMIEERAVNHAFPDSTILKDEPKTAAVVAANQLEVR